MSSGKKSSSQSEAQTLVEVQVAPDIKASTRRTALWSGVRRHRLSIVGIAGLSSLVTTAGIWWFYAGRDLSFYLDEWYFLLYRKATVDGFLAPHGGHIAVIPMAIYQALLHTVGMTDYTPYLSVVLVAHLLIGVLVYIFARRRIGPIASLAPAAIILFLGKGAEDFLWAFQIGFLGPIVTGLAALILVDRVSLKARLSVCGLLVLSVGFSEIGLSFLLAVAILLLADRTRRRDAWIVLVPSVLYGLWYQHYGFGNSSLTYGNLIRTPKFVADEIAGAVQALSGLGPIQGVSGLGLEWGRVLAVILAVFVIRRLASRSADNRMLWSLLAAGGVFWTLVAVTRAELGNPVASRYIYVGSVIVALIVLELVKGVKYGNRGIGILALVTIVIVGANVGYSYQVKNYFQRNAVYLRAELGAVDIARGNIDSNYVLSDSAYNIPSIQVGAYLSAIDKYGSPAYSPTEIETSLEPVRLAADNVFVQAALLRIERGDRHLSAGMQCRQIDPARSAQPYVTDLPAEGLVLRAGSKPVRVSVRRFAQTSAIDIGAIAPSTQLKINKAADEVNIPWRIVIASETTFALCPGDS